VKTDGKGHMQAEKPAPPRARWRDHQHAPRQASARKATLYFCYVILTLRVTASYMRTGQEKSFFRKLWVC